MSVLRPSKNTPGSGRSSVVSSSGWLMRARGWVAGGVIAAVVVTVAVVAQGFDAQELSREEPSVWVTRDAGQYARVNTETGEIDTVRKVNDPSGVVQVGARSAVLTNGNGRAWPVNQANSVDFVTHDNAERAEGSAAEPVSDTGDADTSTGGKNTQEEKAQKGAPGGVSDESSSAAEAVRLPDGTREVLVSAHKLMLRTESGKVYVGVLDEEDVPDGEALSVAGQTDTVAAEAVTEDIARRLQTLTQIDPSADQGGEGVQEHEHAGEGKRKTSEEDVGVRSDAIALSDSGEAVLYSASEGKIWRFDSERGDFVGGAEQLPKQATGLTDPRLALVSDDWVLLDAETGNLWRQGAQATRLKLDGVTQLQASGQGFGPGTGGGTATLVADASGLWQVSEQGDAERVVQASGTPAQPRSVGGVSYAAWVGQNQGVLWNSSDVHAQKLSFDASAKDLGEVSPVFYTNGERAVLGESRTGMLWTVPEGRLIPLSQWTISDPPQKDQGVVTVEEVTEQLPPTAVDDAFGVRQGEPAPVPVLLNDFDPNKRDVLTIVPDSLGESPLPSQFGTIELMPDGQSLMVHPSAKANGQATFTYRVSDGVLSSEPATVTLNIVPEQTNTAPEWCPVEGCQRAWQVPNIAPGGTLVYPILEGWVDPEGDPMILTEVESLRPEDPVAAIVTADQSLAVRHTDANAGGSELMLRVTVRDGFGAEHKKDLSMSVQPDAPVEFQATAATVKVGSPAVLEPLERAFGGSGSFELADVTVQSGAEHVTATARTADGRVEVNASEPGEAMLSLNIRDVVTGSECTGVMRISAVPGAVPLALPPLRAFVRPLSDSTVEILDALPGASSRAVSVVSAKVVDGDVRADVIEHSKVRVSGSTSDGGPGRVGSVDVTISENSVGAEGRLTVFQVAESGLKGAVAVADSATVRAGSVVDIRVLDNDVAVPGERLVLHPEVTGSGAKGELAFASGNTLRYLAPKTPGTYKISYTTYGMSSPEAGDVGSVTVTVVPRGSNQEPEPKTVIARVAAGEKTRVEVPLSGVDPDGDRVQLVGVDVVSDPQITASVSSDAHVIEVSASEQADAGVTNVHYRVRDGFGGNAKGLLRIIVSAASEDSGAPIASSDYVRVMKGARDEVSVSPLDNDIDPAHGILKIVSVVPNLPGGKSHPEFSKALDRLNLSQIKKGVVLVAPGKELGTISYRYTVRSSVSSSTAEGLLLVQTSERVGAQAPQVDDTVLNVRERSEFSHNGVDVVTGKVRWSTGDSSALKLSLWKSHAAHYRVSKNSILGEYNPDGDLVVFQLSGTDASGDEVSSFGFLIIPPLDELRVTLKPGFQAITVNENKSKEVNIRSLLDLTANDRVELQQKKFPVSRTQATCEAVSVNQIRYEAGGEAPWEDVCLMSVRLVGQKMWTQLPVQIMIEPRAPIVEMNALTRTIPPGGSEKIDLMDMVSWKGNRTGNVSRLRFSVSGGGSIFAIQESASTITVDASADAAQGSQEGLTVSVSGEGDSIAPLTLRVGQAPRTKPRGGTVSLTCTVGSACEVDVIGAPGEYDPFEGKRGGGLQLESVSSAACTFGTVRRSSERGVSVTWPDDRGPGGRCTVGFTVRDAQGRHGEGSIELDAQGVPRPPASVNLQSYGEDSVSFVVELGEAQRAHPEVRGVDMSGAGSSSCQPAGPASYQCTVNGLENGEQHSFVARAVNSVGASDPSSPATAWAYRSPEPPEIVELASVPGPEVNTTQGLIRYRLNGGPDVAQYSVSVAGNQQLVGGPDSGVQTIVAPVGETTLTVTSLSRFQPPGNGAAPQAKSVTKTVTVAGAPIAGELSFSTTNNPLQIRATLVNSNNNLAPDGLRYAFFISPLGSEPAACPTNGNEYGNNEKIFDVNNRYLLYKIRGCVWTDFGSAASGPVTTSVGRVAGEKPPTISEGLEFTVNTAPVITGGTRGDYTIQYEANPKASNGLQLKYRVNGAESSSYSHNPDAITQISVQQCADLNDPESCSDWANLVPVTAPTVVRAELLTSACVPTTNAQSVVQISAAAKPFATIQSDDQGNVTITWTGSFSMLNPLVLHGSPCPATPDPDTKTPSANNTPPPTQ